MFMLRRLAAKTVLPVHPYFATTYSFGTLKDEYLKLIEQGKIQESKPQMEILPYLDEMKANIEQSYNPWLTWQNGVEEKRALLELSKPQKVTRKPVEKKEEPAKKKSSSGLMNLWSTQKQETFEAKKVETFEAPVEEIVKLSWKDLAGQIENFDQKTDQKLLYLYGQPGVGKTFLMDFFYDNLDIKLKTRLHYNEFMSQVQKSIAQYDAAGNLTDPVEGVAAKFSQYRVICLDEFFIIDIADAQIIKTFMEALVKYNVLMVFTSNKTIEQLYRGGANYNTFAPFIPFMNTQCNSLYVDGFDLRKSKFNEAIINERLLANVIYPNDAIRNGLFDEKFLEISNVSELDDFTEGKKEEIEVTPGRMMNIPNARNEVCSFEYEDIIGGNRSSAEYMALCKKYHTIMIKNMVPQTGENRDEVRRTIQLVDEMYYKNCKFYMSGPGDLDEIFPEENKSKVTNMSTGSDFFSTNDLNDEEMSIKRAKSRLMEMRTYEYSRKTPYVEQVRVARQEQEKKRKEREAKDAALNKKLGKKSAKVDMQKKVGIRQNY